MISIGLLAVCGLPVSVGAVSNTPIPPIIKIENETASAVGWSPDGTQLAVGDSTGVRLYSSDLQFIRLMPQPSGQMKTLAWSPDGVYLAAYGANDVAPVDLSQPRQTTVFVWNAETGQQITKFDKHTEYVPGLAWSPDGSRIATGSWDRTIRIWNPLTGVVESTIDAPEYPAGNYTNNLDSLSWSHDGELAAVIDAVGVFVWDDFTHEPRELIKHGPRYPHADLVTWSPDDKFIALGIGIYDVKMGQEIDFSNCPGASTWSPDSKYTAIFTVQGIFICDPFNDTVLGVLEGSMGPLTDGILQDVIFGYQDSLSWSPDGKLLAGAAGDGYLRIWDVSHLSLNGTEN